MEPQRFDQRWQELSEEVLSGMKEWRMAHPRATWREMEAALDEKLAGMRARMLQDMALASAAAEWEGEADGEVPVCGQCGQGLKARGKKQRQVLTHGGRSVTLERQYGVCETCGAGFFPPG
jgi:hypothetical protein